MKEIWKDKKDYEGHYQVSNWGRVKSIKFGKERILKLTKDKDGYFFVNLYKNNKSKTFKVQLNCNCYYCSHCCCVRYYHTLCEQGGLGLT